MTAPPPSEEDSTDSAPWTPLSRSEVQALLDRREYTTLHLCLLYWLIWLSLLSGEELLRLLSTEEVSLGQAGKAETKAVLSKHLTTLTKRGLIDAIILREPAVSRHRRYYVTDLGLYLYLAAVRPSPPLSVARLARAYPVARDDLLARLARPHVHLACTSLVTRLIAEGEPHLRLVSYQQPWHSAFADAHRKSLLSSDAAFLLEHTAGQASGRAAGQTSGAQYAFLVHVDVGPHQQTERAVERWLLLLLDLRQQMALSRQSWPGLLIISTPDRLPLWGRLLLESSVQRTTRPLAGGITTLEAMNTGVYTPIWRDLVTLAAAPDPQQVPCLPLSHLLTESASAELAEHFSRQQRFAACLLKEAVLPAPRTTQRLARYVGDSLQDETARLTKARLEASFARKRTSRESLEEAGLLTLALTATEKELLTWAAQHPLLDLPTLQALLRPAADANAIKPLQQTITRLFKLGLLEVRVWPAGPTPFEQQRYLLTAVALKFLALRHGEPLSFSFVPPKYRKSDDEQLWRQWGTAGLSGQMWHTNSLYTFMRQLYRTAYRRGEQILRWHSAHEAARWYRDTVSQEAEHVRPDAELVCALSPDDDRSTTILLEYDRGTMAEHQYLRKFKAYLDYQQATGIALPLLVVTPSQKAAQRIRQVLSELQGTLRVMIVLEKDLLSQGLACVLPYFASAH